MLRGNVPPVQDSKTRAIVNLADEKMSLFCGQLPAKQASFFCLERVERFLRSLSCGNDSNRSAHARELRN